MIIQPMKTILAVLLLTAGISHAYAQEGIDALPVSTIFVASSGMWEQEANSAQQTEPTRGYYKVIAMRQNDGTAKIYLQQIAYSADGPKLMQNVELEEFTQMKAYVTDVRPESSAGAAATPGLFVTVHLKTDPVQKEPDGWTILIDELGDMKIEKASN